MSNLNWTPELNSTSEALQKKVWSYKEDERSIIFNCFGAIDFSRQINIELSLTEKKGFNKTHPLLLMRKLNELKHIEQILLFYFYKIVCKMPNISDVNENLPIENRFIEIYYKCYEKFHYFHRPFGEFSYKDLTLDDAIKYIYTENLAIINPK